MTKVLTVGEHAATLALLAEQATLEGGHDLMEAQPLTPAEKQSATIANAPDPIVVKSRQVRRAEERQRKKDLRRHMNEHVGGKNRKRGQNG